MSGPRPPWWRPFARRRWRPDPPAVLPVVAAPVSVAPEVPPWAAKLLRRRRERLRDRCNDATDAECVDADLLNGVGIFAVRRTARARDEDHEREQAHLARVRAKDVAQ